MAAADKKKKKGNPERGRIVAQKEPEHEWLFSVTSGTRKNEYYWVYLDEHNGNGSCTCPHFCFRLIGALHSGQKPGNKTRCKHILAARDLFCDMEIDRRSRDGAV